MGEEFIHDKVFGGADYSGQGFPYGEYENCSFVNCKFAGADLSGSKFTDCRFEGCDMSLAGLHNTILNNVFFKECKMLGLKFDSCDAFAFSAGFEGCILDNASFFKRKMAKTVFDRCRLWEVDFGDCDMQSVRFPECDLKRAQFADTDLRKADLRTAFNYSIDPNINKIRKAKFSLAGVVGLLESYDIEIEGP